MNEYNSELLSQLEIEKLETIKEELINLELSRKYQTYNILLYHDAIITYDPFDLKSLEIKKEENIEKRYLVSKKEFDRIKEQLVLDQNKIDNEDEDIISEELDDTEVAKLLEQILYSAIVSKISDIHIEPKEKTLKILFRNIGSLEEFKSYEKHYCNYFINKIKTLADMDITSKMKPQDGKFKLKVKGHDIEVRVSTCPTVFGENAILRVQQQKTLSEMLLSNIGFEKNDFLKYEKSFDSPNGLILNVGPTGSGKTTTFALTIKEIVKRQMGTKKIVTAEDPVEIRNPSVTQVEIDDKAGRTFPVVLKSFLRQDPDVILIGEIRDDETGNIAIKASITGHLVLATLHANDSFNAITRMRDLGISDVLISATCNCFLSQKLLKTLCPNCKKPIKISESEKEKYGLKNNNIFERNEEGCPECNKSGYSGRTVVIEVLDFDEEMKTSISSGLSEIELKKIGRKNGFKNIFSNGILKVDKGEVGLAEVLLNLQKDSILNTVKKEDSIKISNRTIYYPNKLIDINIEKLNVIGHLYDISGGGMSIIFDKPILLDINSEINLKFKDNELIFIPKSYGKIHGSNKEKWIIGGIYKGDNSFLSNLIDN